MTQLLTWLMNRSSTGPKSMLLARLFLGSGSEGANKAAGIETDP
jgi:hypothetical protein